MCNDPRFTLGELLVRQRVDEMFGYVTEIKEWLIHDPSLTNGQPRMAAKCTTVPTRVHLVVSLVLNYTYLPPERSLDVRTQTRCAGGLWPRVRAASFALTAMRLIQFAFAKAIPLIDSNWQKCSYADDLHFVVAASQQSS